MRKLPVRLWVLALFLVSGCAGTGTAIPSLDEGESITVYERFPEGEGPFPAVVLLHGCDGARRSRYSWRGLVQHASYLNSIGIAALLVDSYASRDVSVSQSCGESAQYRLPRALDAFAALRHLQDDERIIPDAIGVQGSSQGAAVAIRVISSDPAYAQYAPEPGFAAAVAFYPYCHIFDPLPEVPLLILIGENDDWTPADNCRGWVRQNSKHDPAPRIVVLEGAHHSFDLPGLPLQQFQGHSIGYERNAYERAREHQGEFFLRHLVAD